jgi:hypothetical protein
LDISEDIYTNQKQAQQKLVVLHNTYDAAQNLIYNNQAATCNTLSNINDSNNLTTLAQANTIINSYPYF